MNLSKFRSVSVRHFNAPTWINRQDNVLVINIRVYLYTIWNFYFNLIRYILPLTIDILNSRYAFRNISLPKSGIV